MSKQNAIDLDHLDRYVGGDRSLRDEILGIFEEQAEMWVRTLDPRAEDSAWKDAAHALKGASRGVGAWAIGEICAEAETLIGPDRSEEERLETLASLREAVRTTVTEVRRLRTV